MAGTTKWLITSTPPSANGDLHVGYSNNAISSTLAAFNIEIESYKPVDDDHQKFLQSFLQPFFQSLAIGGVFTEKEVELPFDTKLDRFLFESFVQGYCPVCLSCTKGGVCEDCGHLIVSNDLIDSQPVRSDANGVEYRSVRQLYLNLDDYRKALTAFYNEKGGYWRLHIIRLVTELLAIDSVGDFPRVRYLEKTSPAAFPLFSRPMTAVQSLKQHCLREKHSSLMIRGCFIWPRRSLRPGMKVIGT